ncbi:MAG: hypothetical protein M3O29_04360 [Actinomycetota bacterium]|nr:hypothetical protein [Actinomycetota bacterium]
MGDLREVESTVEAIWASCARMDVGNGSVGSSGHSTAPDPTNARAYDTGRTLNVILTGWARSLGHHQPHAVKAATVLLLRIREVREADWAPVLKQELHDALNDCRRAMDRSGPRIFAGTCPGPDDMPDCGTPVYAPAGKPEARCQTCGVTWDVTEWRERAMIAAGPATGTAVELSRILSDPTRALVFPQNKISVWVNRGKLSPIGHRDGRPVYQVRKVRNLWDRALIESAVRSERMRLAKAERERAEWEAARTERRERIAA